MSRRWPPAFAEALGDGGGDALLITRNNVALAVRLAAEFPALRWEVLTKADLRGWGARRLLRVLRARRRRLFVIEDRPAELARRRDLYCLLLLAGRARTRWLLAAEEEAISAESVPWFRGWLGEIGSLAVEGVATAAAVAYAEALARRLDCPAPHPRPAPSRRVALLKTEFWFDVRVGGSVSHALGVAGGMRALGLEPRLWSTSRLPAPAESLTQTLVLPTRRPSLFEEAAAAGFNRTFVSRVEPELREFAPAVVYHRHDAFSLAGLALARRLGVPLVLEVNASEVWARRAWSRLVLRRLAERMERTAFARADRLILISDELVPTVTALGGTRDRIVVNPNGVDVSRFDPADRGESVRAALGIPPEGVVCGFLGTFTCWHGVLFLASRVAPLAARDPRLRFLFLGDGEYRPQVEAALAADGVADRARFTGLLAPADVPRHLAACDILLSPHLPFEDGTEFFGSPTKLFEYMAAGRAIVASRLGPIGRILDDGETGLLVPPGEEAPFEDAVLRLAGDPRERARLGGNARTAAEAKYTWTANARRSLEGLIELPASSPGKSA